MQHMDLCNHLIEFLKILILKTLALYEIGIDIFLLFLVKSLNKKIFFFIIIKFIFCIVI